MSAAAAVVLVASAVSAGAQGLAYPPGAHKPYTLVLDVFSPDGKAEGHSSTKCTSFVERCDVVVKITVEGTPLKVWAHGRADDGRTLRMLVEPGAGNQWGAFERTGFDIPAAAGQERQGDLIHTARKWVRTAKSKSAAGDLVTTHTVIGKVRIRIDR